MCIITRKKQAKKSLSERHALRLTVKFSAKNRMLDLTIEICGDVQINTFGLKHLKAHSSRLLKPLYSEVVLSALRSLFSYHR